MPKIWFHTENEIFFHDYKKDSKKVCNGKSLEWEKSRVIQNSRVYVYVYIYTITIYTITIYTITSIFELRAYALYYKT